MTTGIGKALGCGFTELQWNLEGYCWDGYATSITIRTGFGSLQTRLRLRASIRLAQLLNRIPVLIGLNQIVTLDNIDLPNGETITRYSSPRVFGSTILIELIRCEAVVLLVADHTDYDHGNVCRNSRICYSLRRTGVCIGGIKCL